MTTDSAAAQTTPGRARARLALVPVLVGLVVLAGCGSSSKTTSSSSTPSTPATTPSTPATTSSSSSEPSSGAGGALNVAAASGGQLEFNTKSLTAKAGKVSIDFTNMAPLSHNLTIESSSGQKLGATPTFSGGSKTLSLTLKPGTYKFFCSVPGHRQAGMEGTLTVQ